MIKLHLLIALNINKICVFNLYFGQIYSFLFIFKASDCKCYFFYVFLNENSEFITIINNKNENQCNIF